MRLLNLKYMKLQINIDTDTFGKKEGIVVGKVLLTIILMVVAWFADFSINEWGIILYFVLRVIFKPNEKESLILACVCLIGVAVLLAFSFESLAEQIAIDAYWFLVIACASRVFYPLTKQP